MKPKVLIADEEAMLCEAIAYILHGAGLEPFKAMTGEAALQIMQDEKPQIILLSATLPCCINPSTCAEKRLCCTLQQNAGSSLLMWSTDPHPDEKTSFLECGADDCLVKPFGMRELVARVHALLRRAQSAPALMTKDEVTASGIRLSVARREAWIEEDNGPRLLPLSRIEFNLLHFLMAHRDRVVSRDLLLERVWGVPPEKSTGDRSTVNVHLMSLRRKLGDTDTRNPRYIVTVMRSGWKFKE